MNIPGLGAEQGLWECDLVILRVLSHSHVFHSTESFRLSYYPHRLDEFTGLLKEAFGENCEHTVFGDFKSLEEVPEPAFYIHLVEKPVQ